MNTASVPNHRHPNDLTSITSVLSLQNGVQIPRFGLGVWSSKPGDETFQAVRAALAAGYRHIDTAEGYRNEADVGRAVRESGVARSDIFITTKLAKKSMGFDAGLRAFEQSMQDLGMDFVDLYLIHWPSPATRRESWKLLERLYNEKRTRAIGVSNYTLRHLEEMKDYASVVPMVNQVEFSPFLYQKDLVTYCTSHHIAVTAYSPLTRGDKMQHPVIAKVGAKHAKTPAQVMIRWALEHQLIVIPKSAREQRIKENADVFDFSLDAEDMQALDGLHENYRCNPNWNPENEQ